MSADGFWGAGGHDQPDRPDRPETPHAGADTPSVARRVPNADRHEPPTDERHTDQPPPNRRPAKWVEPRTDEPEARTHTDEPGTDEPVAREVPNTDRHERRTDEPRTDEPDAKDATPEVGSSQEGTLQSGQAQVALPHSARPHSDIRGSGTNHGRLEDFTPDRPDRLEQIYQRLDEIDTEFSNHGYVDGDDNLAPEAWESDHARHLAQERFDLLREVVNQSDFNVPESMTPIFYTGRTQYGKANHVLAAEYAAKNNGALIEATTQGGRWLNDEDLYSENDPIRLLEPDGKSEAGQRELARAIWVEASGSYADAVARPGRHIVAFVDPENDRGIYYQVERPRLVAGGVQLDERSE